jgi:carbamoyl-phosphate synthase large subunit
MARIKLSKVLILGSGALKIGEAGEFDYSGSQAIKALKEDGIRTVLVNPNIATYQTSHGVADEIYFLPVTPEFVEKVIIKEKPDALLLSFGGQTALNCGVALDAQGILKKHKIKVLGTPVDTIRKTEDRELFKQELKKIGVLTPRSISCTTLEQALKATETIGFPIMTRAAYTLGGFGSGFANNEKELMPLLEKAFGASPQVLIEENLRGWKELEYEVVRDAEDNCITVCNMENFDPLGIHTGESIVVAPSQTLTNHEYHMLREIAQKTIRHLGIVGECNIQFALDPKSLDYRVIEVNARLSRSSALASKATGYPLAYVAAKIALGNTLPQLKNSVTRITTADFEPALDYCAVKIPRWDLNKFQKVSEEITSEMKSVGEIMALGRSFEEAIQKGVRMLAIGADGFDHSHLDIQNLQREIEVATPRRLFAISKAFEKGWTVEEIHKLTGIDPWFLYKLENIHLLREDLNEHKNELTKAVRGKASEVAHDLMLEAKKHGFSDIQIAKLMGVKADTIRSYRKKHGIRPYVKQVDTLAAEFPAKTNYLYMTYHADSDDMASKPNKKRIIVLGSGAYCIGSSVEFDWSCINVIQTLRREGYETIMLNYNPETVSTDYDMCDKLYFDELTLERILDVVDIEKPMGVVVSTGGQIPNNLAHALHKAGVKLLGTPADMIDMAENRHAFSGLLDTLGIDQPKWKEAISIEDATQFSNDVGYPVLIRPSYVLSGAAMSVAHDEKVLKVYLEKATSVSKEVPVVISKFEMNSKEIEVDGVAHKGDVLIYAISEHIENAGVHSGDATIVLPPQRLYLETIRRVKIISKKIAKALNISGPFNIQFLARGNKVKVIECNLRASRSFPFVSKVTGYNFIEIATLAILNSKKVKEIRKTKFKTLEMDHVGVKAAQFSFARLKGADPVLGVEMASTGEVGTFGNTLQEAFLTSLLSVGFRMPKKNILLSIGKIEDKADFLHSASILAKLKFQLYATEGTQKFLDANNIPCKLLHRVSDAKSPNITEYLRSKKLDLVINIPKSYSREELTDGYSIRRVAIDTNTPLITNLQLAKMIAEVLENDTHSEIQIKSWAEYLR